MARAQNRFSCGIKSDMETLGSRLPEQRSRWNWRIQAKIPPLDMPMEITTLSTLFRRLLTRANRRSIQTRTAATIQGFALSSCPWFWPYWFMYWPTKFQIMFIVFSVLLNQILFDLSFSRNIYKYKSWFCLSTILFYNLAAPSLGGASILGCEYNWSKTVL